MTCLELELDLDDYVDQVLDRDGRRRVEQHLAGCAACRALVADLQALRVAAATLQPHVPPPQLGMRIAAAVKAESRSRRASHWIGVSGIGFGPALSAAAVVALLVGGSWLAFRDAAAPTPRPRPVARAERPLASPLQPVATTFTDAEQQYTDAIASLEQIANTESTALDQPIAAVVQENLAVVDRAIGESRQAVRQDPSSEVAQESLFDALESKISLLQQAVALINQMRNGNSDGAARIVSGIKP